MARGSRKWALLLAGVVVFYPAMAWLFLLALPQPREPLQYMVAGAFATAVSLLAVFLIYAVRRVVNRPAARTAPGSAPQS